MGLSTPPIGVWKPKNSFVSVAPAAIAREVVVFDHFVRDLQLVERRSGRRQLLRPFAVDQQSAALIKQLGANSASRIFQRSMASIAQRE